MIFQKQWPSHTRPSTSHGWDLKETGREIFDIVCVEEKKVEFLPEQTFRQETGIFDAGILHFSYIVAAVAAETVLYSSSHNSSSEIIRFRLSLLPDDGFKNE